MILEIVETEAIIVLVDMAGAPPLKLVGKPARPHHHNSLIPRPGPQGPVHGPAKRKAALRARQGVLNGVDRDRHDADGPCLCARPAKLERHHHRVVQQHLLTHGDVKIRRHQRLDHMPRQRLCAIDRDRYRYPPALIVIGVGRRRPDSKGRHLVEEKVETVVVVESHHHIGPHPVEPLAHRRKAVEERLPVGIILQPARDRVANRRDMACADTADDLRHVSCPCRR